MKKPVTIKLNEAKEDPKVLEQLMDLPAVYIYSDEVCHQAYWREGGSGYTNRIGANVGMWTGQEAWEKTMHCGQEKFIEFEEVIHERSEIMGKTNTLGVDEIVAPYAVIGDSDDGTMHVVVYNERCGGGTQLENVKITIKDGHMHLRGDEIQYRYNGVFAEPKAIYEDLVKEGKYVLNKKLVRQQSTSPPPGSAEDDKSRCG